MVGGRNGTQTHGKIHDQTGDEGIQVPETRMTDSGMDSQQKNRSPQRTAILEQIDQVAASSGPPKARLVDLALLAVKYLFTK
jgi:hypothetical protein